MKAIILCFFCFTEYVLVIVFTLNVVVDAFKFLWPRLTSSPVELTPEQQKLLGIKNKGIMAGYIFYLFYTLAYGSYIMAANVFDASLILHHNTYYISMWYCGLFLMLLILPHSLFPTYLHSLMS